MILISIGNCHAALDYTRELRNLSADLLNSYLISVKTCFIKLIEVILSSQTKCLGAKPKPGVPILYELWSTGCGRKSPYAYLLFLGLICAKPFFHTLYLKALSSWLTAPTSKQNGLSLWPQNILKAPPLS